MAAKRFHRSEGIRMGARICDRRRKAFVSESDYFDDYSAFVVHETLASTDAAVLIFSAFSQRGDVANCPSDVV
jgi:hypothetical protein